MRDCDNTRLITAVTDGFATYHALNPAGAVTAAAAGRTCAFSVHGYPESERSSYMSTSPSPHVRGHRVRELVCSYRALRDAAGHAVHVPTLALSDPRTAAMALGPLLAQERVEVFAVACLSTRHRLLTWHIVSRGTRASTPVSMPDVFVPACLTPGTSAIVVVHNHPAATRRRVLTMRDSRFVCVRRPTSSTCRSRSPHRRRGGTLLQLPRSRCARHACNTWGLPMTTRRAITTFDSRAPLSPVKPLRFAPTPVGAGGLDGRFGVPRLGNYVMARRSVTREDTEQHFEAFTRSLALDHWRTS